MLNEQITIVVNVGGGEGCYLTQTMTRGEWESMTEVDRNNYIDHAIVSAVRESDFFEVCVSVK